MSTEGETELQRRQILSEVAALAVKLERENERLQTAGKAGLSRGKLEGLLQELTGVLEACARDSGQLAEGIRHVRGVLAGTRDGLRLAGGRDRCAKEHHGYDDPKETSVGNLRKNVDEAMTMAEKAEDTVAEVAREAAAAILEDAQELNHLECIEDETDGQEVTEEEKGEEKSTTDTIDLTEVAHNSLESTSEVLETEEQKVAGDEKESAADTAKHKEAEKDKEETEKKDDDKKDTERSISPDNKRIVDENATKHFVEKPKVTKSEEKSSFTIKTRTSSKSERKNDSEKNKLDTSAEDDVTVDEKALSNPGIWSMFPFETQNDDGQSELACLIKVDIQAVSSFPVTCQIANHLAPSALAHNEELVSNVVQLSPAGLKLQAPVIVSLPYTWSRHVSRELAVKVTNDGETWKTVSLKASDVVYKDRKGHFVEFQVSRLASYVVVSRLKVETFSLQKSRTKPNVFRSSVDQRIELNFPPGAIKAVGVLDVQVQPVDSVSLSSLKSRCSECDTLISTSPMVTLSLSPVLRLHKPVEITVPCPLNPAGNWARDPTRPGTAGLGGSRKLVGSSPRPGSAPASRTGAMDDGKHGDDFLHLLSQSEGEDGWSEVMGVRFRQNKKGIVTFELSELLGRFIVLRTADPAAEQFQSLTETLPRMLETSLTLTDVRLILRTKTSDPERAVVRCVPARDVREAQLQLDAAGYEEAEPSKEVLLQDGDQLVLKFSGNVTRDTDGDSRDSVRLTFYSQRRTQTHLYIKEVNEYGNYSSPCYRGMARFYGTRRSVGKAGEDTARGPPEMIKNAFLGDAVEEGLDIVCKVPVSLPKREREPPRPPSAYRKLIESQGPLVNDWLQWLAAEIDEDWDMLGHHLRVKRSRLQHIKRNNPDDVQQQAFDMLYSWRKSLPAATDKIGKLCRALSRVGRRDLAEELRERYSDHRKQNGNV